MNAQMERTSRRRGKAVMKTFKELREKHGLALAKQLRDNKKELQLTKPVDEPDFWYPHPDFPKVEDCCYHFTCTCLLPLAQPPYLNLCLSCMQDMELFRVFDSLVFEDEKCDRLLVGVKHSGSMDPSQAEASMYLGLNIPGMHVLETCVIRDLGCY